MGLRGRYRDGGQYEEPRLRLWQEATSFSIYRFESRDRLVLCGMAGLLLVLGVCALQGGTQAEYTPGLSIAGPDNFYTIAGVVAYALFLAIPAGINLTEELKWHILRSKNLSFSYPTAGGRKALDNINLTIERGQYVTFCGRSGCGKTTLLRQLKSALTPHGKRTGEILFDGTLIGNVGLREQSARIGYVMQDPDNQIVTDKVWHELAFGLESLGVDQKTIRLRVAEMASYFGIQGWFHKKVTELSGGQKQLLNLASIMAMQPDVLILDEPTSQLDPIAASDFLNTVRKINRELRTTVLITEHRLEDIFHASDLVVVMEDGKVLTADGPRQVGAFLKERTARSLRRCRRRCRSTTEWLDRPQIRQEASGRHMQIPASDRARRCGMAGHPFDGSKPEKTVIEDIDPAWLTRRTSKTRRFL